jgi:hypothetical protein
MRLVKRHLNTGKVSAPENNMRRAFFRAGLYDGESNASIQAGQPGPCGIYIGQPVCSADAVQLPEKRR